MKIIKEGYDKEEHIYEGTCNRCGVQFECGWGDTIREHPDLTICPHCQNIVKITIKQTLVEKLKNFEFIMDDKVILEKLKSDAQRQLDYLKQVYREFEL